jgi:muconolactone delta-isomerase
MEFLVHIQVNWPPEGDAEMLVRLTEAERARARELAVEGRIRRLWRIPGRFATWGIWEATDASELHAAVNSLPLIRYLDITVYPLATHPSDPGPNAIRQAATRS